MLSRAREIGLLDIIETQAYAIYRKKAHRKLFKSAMSVLSKTVSYIIAIRRTLTKL